MKALRFLGELLVMVAIILIILVMASDGCRDEKVPTTGEVPSSTQSLAPNNDIHVQSAPMPDPRTRWTRWGVSGYLLVEPDKHGRPSKNWVTLPYGALVLLPHTVPDSAKVHNRRGV